MGDLEVLITHSESKAIYCRYPPDSRVPGIQGPVYSNEEADH